MITSPSNELIINDIISINIKKYRKKIKITQKELAARCNYSYAYIRRLESLKSQKNFSISTIYNISKALNIDIKNLFDDKDIQ